VLAARVIFCLKAVSVWGLLACDVVYPKRSTGSGIDMSATVILTSRIVYIPVCEIIGNWTASCNRIFVRWY